MQNNLSTTNSYTGHVVIESDEVRPGLLSIVGHDVRDPEQVWLDPQHGDAIPVVGVPFQSGVRPLHLNPGMGCQNLNGKK